MKDYETEVVQDHYSLDLYRTKGKTRSKISFNDLTLHEQLNYVRWNLKDTREGFQMFEIINREQPGQLKDEAHVAEVACAIVQMTGTKTKKLPEGFKDKNEFRALLKAIQKGVPLLSSKSLVDTLFGLSKLKKQPEAKYY